MSKFEPEDVRQGRRMGVVSRILVFSLGLALVSLALTFWFTT